MMADLTILAVLSRYAGNRTLSAKITSDPKKTAIIAVIARFSSSKRRYAVLAF